MSLVSLSRRSRAAWSTGTARGTEIGTPNCDNTVVVEPAVVAWAVFIGAPTTGVSLLDRWADRAG